MEDQERLIMASLDPSALEFHPSSQFALPFLQIYYPCHPPPPPPPQLLYHYVYPPQAAANDANAATLAVVLSMVPPHVTEPLVVQSMLSFGGVPAVDLSLLPSQGTVAVHFYDLRTAHIAVADVLHQHVRQQSRLGHHFYGFLPPPAPPPEQQQQQHGLIEGQAVRAQFAAQGLDAMNQGSLFVAVSDPAVSVDAVRDIFQVFGPVTEVRESPTNPQHKFVEFFHVRDAARALNELNGKEINGSCRIFVEFNRLFHEHTRSHYHKRFAHQNSAPLPPRLARSNWQASSSSERGGVKIVMRSDARISNVSRNRNANQSSGSGKRNRGSRYNSIRSNYPSSAASSESKQQRRRHQLMSRKSWKNHGRNGVGGVGNIMLDVSRYEFKETGEFDGGESVGSSSSAASSCHESRTTVMIKNIPNKYSQKLLLNMLDNYCIHSNEKIIGGGDEPLSAYDFVYLPIDFNNKCNVGYGFVNLTSPEATIRLHKAFHMHPWEVFNSRKICQVTYARLQGLEALKEHFKNSKLACDNEEYMPAVFEPPRDGKMLTEPVPMGTQCIKIRAVGDEDEEDDNGGSDDETGSGGISEQLAAQLQISASSSP